MRLLDTDVLVDIVRGYGPALQWLGRLADAPGLPGFCVMEVVAGCRNKREMNRVYRDLGVFRIHWPTDSDCSRALDDLVDSHLSHNLGLLDALIGEIAVGLNATLCTFNQKHFEIIPGLPTEQPYRR